MTPELQVYESNVVDGQPNLVESSEIPIIAKWDDIDVDSVEKMQSPDGNYTSLVRLTDGEDSAMVAVFNPTESKIDTFRTSYSRAQEVMVTSHYRESHKIDIPAIINLAYLGGTLEGMPEPKIYPVDPRVAEVLEANKSKLEKAIDEVRVISLDVDDTLMPTTSIIDQLTWSRDFELFQSYFEDLRRAGISIILNTGRGIEDTSRVMKILASLGCNVSEAICENGAITYNYANNEYEINPDIDMLTMSVRDKTESFLNKYFAANPKIGRLEAGKKVGISINPTIETLNLIDKSKLEISDDDHDIDIFRKFMVDYLKANKDQIVEPGSAEEENAFEAMLSLTANSSTAVDLNPAIKQADGSYIGIDKMRGTSSWMKQHGVLPNEMIIGGDSSGDKPAVKAAGAFFAVPNGKTEFMIDPEIKDKLIFVPKYGFTNGVTEFLDYVINNRKRTIRKY